MPGFDRGRNEGVTGLADFPGFGAPQLDSNGNPVLDGSGNPVLIPACFECSAQSFELESEAEPINAAGRGDGQWPENSPGASTGGLVINAKLMRSGWPHPSQLHNAVGTILLQYDGGDPTANPPLQPVMELVPVRATSFKINFEVSNKDVWDVTLGCLITDDPTASGFGVQNDGSVEQQPVPPAETLPDKTMWDGLLKRIDTARGNLQDTASIKILVRGVGDTDTAEQTRIANLISSMAPPLAGLKQRPAVFTHHEKIKGAGYVTLTWQRTDTRDDVVLPQTQTTIDPKGLTSNATSAEINGTPAAPIGPGLVKRTSKSQKLHDSAVDQVDEYGVRDTQDDVEMPGTELAVDPDGIAIEGSDTHVYSGSGAPTTTTLPITSTDAQVIDTATQQLDQTNSKKVFKIGMRTPLQEIEWLQSKQVDEPTALEESSLVVLFGDGPSLPDSETLDALNPDPDNLSFDRCISNRYTKSRWVQQFLFSPLTPQEKLEADGSLDVDDPLGQMAGDDKRRQVTDSEIPPDAPTVAGVVLGRVETKRVGKARWQHDFFYDFRDSVQKLEADKQEFTFDPQDLQGKQVSADVFAVNGSPPQTPNPPTGLKFYNYIDLPTPNPAYTLRVYTWSKRDSRDEAELGTLLRPHVITAIDPSGLESYATDAKIDLQLQAPQGMVLRLAESIPLTRGSSSDHTLVKVQSGLRTTKEDREFPGTFVNLDPIGLETNGRTTVVFTTGQTPNPQAPPNTKLIRSKSTQLTSAGTTPQSEGVFEFGTRSSADELTLRNTFTIVDPTGLTSRAQAAALDNPPALPGGFALRATRTLPQTQGLDTDHALVVVEGGLTTPQQDIEFRETVAIADPLDLYKTRTASIVPWNGTAAALANSLNAGNKNDATYVQAQAMLKTPALALQIIENTGEDQKRHSGVADEVRWWPFRGRPQAGFGQSGAFGNAAAFVLVRPTAAGGGSLSGVIVPVMIQRNRTRFKVRRRWITATPREPEQFYFRGSVGTVNSTTFCGVPALQCMYLGPEPIYNGTNNDNHLVVVDYCFTTDNLMFVNDGQLPDVGSRLWVASANSPITAAGFYDPGIFAGGGVFGLLWPGVNDFSVFEVL